MDSTGGKDKYERSQSVGLTHDQRILDIRLSASFALFQQAQDIKLREQQEAARIKEAREKILLMTKAEAAKRIEVQRDRTQKMMVANRRLINESIRQQRERFAAKKESKKQSESVDHLVKGLETNRKIEEARQKKIDSFNQKVREFEKQQTKVNENTLDNQKRIYDFNFESLRRKAERANKNRSTADESHVRKINDLANKIIHNMIHHEETNKSKLEEQLQKKAANEKTFKAALESKKDRIQSLYERRREEIQERIDRQKTKFSQALSVLKENKRVQEEKNKQRDEHYSDAARRVKARHEEDVS